MHSHSQLCSVSYIEPKDLIKQCDVPPFFFPFLGSWFLSLASQNPGYIWWPPASRPEVCRGDFNQRLQHPHGQDPPTRVCELAAGPEGEEGQVSNSLCPPVSTPNSAMFILPPRRTYRPCGAQPHRHLLVSEEEVVFAS